MDCGVVKIRKRRYDETGLCSKCEAKPLPHEQPQDTICWNKHCKSPFIGTMADNEKYTLCPKCRKMRREYDCSKIDQGISRSTAGQGAGMRKTFITNL